MKEIKLHYFERVVGRNLKSFLFYVKKGVGWHTVYWTLVIIMISKCLDFEEKWQVTYTPPALWTRQNAIFINICRHSRPPPNKTWSYGFHKALYFSSIDIFFCVYTLKYFLTYWKLAFGIWRIQKSARGKRHTASPDCSEKTGSESSGVAGFGGLWNLSLKIKADGFASALLAFQCYSPSWDLEAFSGTIFAPTVSPAGGRALLVMLPELYW